MKTLFGEINDYFTQYDQVPEIKALKIEIDKRKDLSQEIVTEIEKFLDESIDNQQYNDDWLVETTEKWCKERAIYLALMDSIKIADGQDKTRQKDAIPHIMSEALGTCFDETVGHDYIQDADERYDFYHKEDKIPFDLEYFNKITKVVYLARLSMSRLWWCREVSIHVPFASSCLMQGGTFSYITLEMAKKIAELTATSSTSRSNS